MIAPFENSVPVIHSTAFLAEDAVVIGDTVVGEHSSIWFGSVLRGDVNYIRIGTRTNIQDQSVVHVSSHDHPTVVGNDVTVGHRVTLHGCHVESNCLIGIGAILLDGVRVGRNSLVGAGSLLTPGTVVPPGSLIMGSPAKTKRQLTPQEISDIASSAARYVELAAAYRRMREG